MFELPLEFCLYFTLPVCLFATSPVCYLTPYLLHLFATLVTTYSLPHLLATSLTHYLTYLLPHLLATSLVHYITVHNTLSVQSIFPLFNYLSYRFILLLYFIMAIGLGQRFLSWEDLQSALEDWAISLQFEFQKWKKNKVGAYYICQHKSNGCEWRFFASYNKNHEIEVKTLPFQHTCASMGLVGGEVVLTNQQFWLQRVVPTHLFITKSTKVQEIIDCVRMHYAQTTSYQAARKVKAFLIDD